MFDFILGTLFKINDFVVLKFGIHSVPVNSQAHFRLARDLLIANSLFLSLSVEGDSAEWRVINLQLTCPC